MTFSLGVSTVKMKILEVVTMASKTCEVCAPLHVGMYV